MNTRVVKTTKGYVAQLWLVSNETTGWLWWKKPVWKWHGISTFSYAYADEFDQIQFCLAKTEEEAFSRFELYKEKEEKKKVYIGDLCKLSSN